MDYIKLNAAASTLAGIIEQIMKENGISAGEMSFCLDRVKVGILAREAQDAEAILFNMKQQKEAAENGGDDNGKS